jgi:hypothetical protein
MKPLSRPPKAGQVKPSFDKILPTSFAKGRRESVPIKNGDQREIRTFSKTKTFYFSASVMSSTGKAQQLRAFSKQDPVPGGVIPIGQLYSGGDESFLVQEPLDIMQHRGPLLLIDFRLLFFPGIDLRIATCTGISRALSAGDSRASGPVESREAVNWRLTMAV